jgi:CMP-2-keto-3-deoxyoctulosonic acid synthetase
LVEHKINQLLKTNVDEIIVGSDDIRLKKIVEKYNNKKVIFLKCNIDV